MLCFSETHELALPKYGLILPYHPAIPYPAANPLFLVADVLELDEAGVSPPEILEQTIVLP